MRSIVLLLLVPLTAQAQVPLAEAQTPDAVTRSELALTLSGAMKFERNSRVETVPIEATGKHDYIERVVGAAQTLRYYFTATSKTTIGIERGSRSLDDKHRLIVAKRTIDGPHHYSPAGPLTRDELSQVAEHFNAGLVPNLLPGKAVAIGDTWPIRDETVNALCLFDGLVKHTLTGKLTDADSKMATFTVEGKAEGIEQGARVKLTISARGQFDLGAKRISHLVWEQNDQREQGPVSPAMEAKVKLTLTRSLPAEEPKELSAAVWERIAQPVNRATLEQIRYAHPDSKYLLIHDRNWHAVVQTETHLVLRLVVRGELIAQVTITPWKNADAVANTDVSIKEFLDSTVRQPGWQAEKTLTSSAMPTDRGRTIYRHVASGKQDGIAVVQSFHRVVNADGRQVIVTCVVRPEMLEKLGTRDAALASAIEFPATK